MKERRKSHKRTMRGRSERMGKAWHFFKHFACLSWWNPVRFIFHFQFSLKLHGLCLHLHATGHPHDVSFFTTPHNPLTNLYLPINLYISSQEPLLYGVIKDSHFSCPHFFFLFVRISRPMFIPSFTFFCFFFKWFCKYYTHILLLFFYRVFFINILKIIS